MNPELRAYMEESNLEKIKRVTMNIINAIVKFIKDTWALFMQKVRELKERFKNNPKVQALLNKINNSRIMQTLQVAKNCKFKIGKANSVDEANAIKDDAANAKNVQNQEAENAKGILAKVKELVKGNKNDANTKNTLTSAFFRAVESKDKRLVRIMLADSLLIDKTFRESELMIKECNKRDFNPFTSDDSLPKNIVDNENQWTTDYMNRQMVAFKGGYSGGGTKAHYNHLKQVVRYVYKNRS